MYDVVIVGGGPAGLAAALNLGRARKRVLLCDAGEPRNQRAEHIHGFVTQDGTPPREFRRIGREQLLPYDVELRAEHVVAIGGERDAFQVQLGDGVVSARRVLLCVGMVDVLPDLPGYRELWGRAVFQCPYCHGWEIRERAFGVLCASVEFLEFAFFLQSWSRDLIVFTDGQYAVPEPVRARLSAAGIGLEERRLTRIHTKADGDALNMASIEVADGTRIEREFLFARPPQRQTALVTSLGLTLDAMGFVVVDPQSRQTSRPGIYAGGDSLTMMQGALLAAATGAQASYMLNHELTMAPLP